MKEIFLIRHAKSSWSSPELSDFDRPLNKRGLRDAPDMADRAKTAGFQPDTIVSSPAARARATAETFAEALELEPIHFKDELYLASAFTIINTIQALGSNTDSAMFFGHNPGMTQAVNSLTGSEIENVPTCGVSQITFDVQSWDEIKAGSGELVLFDYPKNKPPQ